jgi:F0F1-type ATP synthase assembly protein I
MAREARYDHDLFWPSPADSPEVQKAMQMLSLKGTAGWITGVLVLTLALVSWDSALVLPLSVGFIGIGYLNVISSALGSRASIRRIVERARDQQLAELREQIAPFKSRYDLSTRESEQLRELLFLHDRIRDAPASPSATYTVLRAAAGLIIPTIVFIITVLGEVSAERLLDTILP